METTNSTTLKVENKTEKPKNYNLTLNHILKPILFLVVALLFEIVNFSSLKLQFLPTFILFDLGVFLFFAGIVFLCGKNWLSNIFFFLFLSFQFLFNIVNASVLKASEDVFFFEILVLASEATSSFDWSFIDFASIIYNTILMVATIACVVLIDIFGKKKVFSLKKITKPILLFVTFFFSWIIGLTFYSSQAIALTYSKSETEVGKFNSDLWKELEYKITGLEKFGTYGFYIKDFYNQYLRKIDYDAQKADYVKWLKEGETEVNKDAKLYGQNLIMICMESIDSFAIDPFNTPTLWKLCNQDGIFMENFYSKNKTNISEDISLLGYVPKTTVLEIENENAMSVRYSLPNLFKELGYSANYFHSYVSTFYNRVNVNKNIGFENVYFLEDADFEDKSTGFNTWNCEVDYFNSMKDKMIKTDGSPFFSFYMTVSAHGTYDIVNPNFTHYYEMYDSHLAEFKPWFEANTSFTYPKSKELEQLFRAYKSAAMDTDAMVKEMIDYLAAQDLLDTTTIVLFADHDCFYNEMSTEIKLQNGEASQEKYHVPLVIYNNKLDHEVVSNFTTVYSIYPTICDLYGLAYNTNMCHGVSLFDEDQSQNVMYSTEAVVGYFDKNCSSITLLDIKKANESVTEDDVNKFLTNAKRLQEKQRKLNFIYKSKWSRDILN